MATRNKSNAEFHEEVQEILARHESNFDQVHATLQTILIELQSLRLQHTSQEREINPFATAHIPSHQPTSLSTSKPDWSHTQLKLSFSKFSGDDPTGWIYKAEQYFDFQNIASEQQVQLVSFHLEGIALQWHRWLTKFKGP
ncbi:hypothetical protein WN944_026539 [Citrus x changshan-huyou]|uniref:Retrotransposon gag domain-containing protein n=1 Tax=Citrus x changshan-huyou TaxID=2935761 RepID=A0AAP0LT73_9ROSI